MLVRFGCNDEFDLCEAANLIRARVSERWLELDRGASTAAAAHNLHIQGLVT